ncbi:GNAT family N-acetyltransferase, partial [Streptomyces sp. NPDC088178]
MDIAPAQDSQLTFRDAADADVPA